MEQEAVAVTLAQRYGGPRDSRRRLIVGLCVVLAVAFGGWLTWATVAYVDADVTSELESFEIVDDSTVNAVVRVDVADAEVAATCRVRAFAEDHTNVGEVAFTPDASTSRQSITIRTERRATAVESLGCTTPNQPRPR